MDIGRPIADNEIDSLDVGDIFYECEMGINIQAKVTSKPKKSIDADGRDYWEWSAVNNQNGEELYYRLTDGLSHYGPRLYTRPQYAHNKDGEFYFKLFGDRQ